MYSSLLRPLLFRLSPERAHTLTHKAAQFAAASSPLRSIFESIYAYESPRLSQHLLGCHFKNPVGLAAGFDKNACLISAMHMLGMGFTEIGSITAQPSQGNPLPRMFRLPKDRALINRMGLNNDGAQQITNRIRSHHYSIPVGINIAKTHAPSIMGDAALDDYLQSLRLALPVADYITLNISCPNTAEGKTFEQTEALKALLAHIFEAEWPAQRPVLVKFSPDLTPSSLADLLAVCEAFPLAGYVATNTSGDRSNLKTEDDDLDTIGAGGLSGAPLQHKSLRTVRQIRNEVSPEKIIIGVGGLSSAAQAIDMLNAGANLLQLYTGLVYEGPGIISAINRGIDDYLKAQGLKSITELHQ